MYAQQLPLLMLRYSRADTCRAFTSGCECTRAPSVPLLHSRYPPVVAGRLQGGHHQQVPLRGAQLHLQDRNAHISGCHTVL